MAHNREMTVPIELRWNDYSLSEDDVDVRAMLREFFAEQSPPDVVRAAEPLGFDESLWRSALRAGIADLSLPEEHGGQGAGLTELVLAAEEVGRTVAPVPLVDHAVATRLLAELPETHPDLASAVAGDLILSIAPLSARRPGAQLVPSGAVARGVLAMDGDDLVLLRRESAPAPAANQADAPVAWWDAADPEVERTVLATGESARALWRRAEAEWQVVTASALVGLAEGASLLARRYTMQRKAFGQPIAAFQAISHTLVDVHEAVQTARNLTLKAAWFLAEEPDSRPDLPTMALANAARVATDVTMQCVHVHGGFGIMLEADVSLYHRRAAVWGQLGGGSSLHLQTIAAGLDRLATRTAAPATAQAGPTAAPVRITSATSRPAADLITSRES
jgi:alkylation response protein AidB-like acyl-CoA dehydrogenase